MIKVREIKKKTKNDEVVELEAELNRIDKLIDKCYPRETKKLKELVSERSRLEFKYTLMTGKKYF